MLLRLLLCVSAFAAVTAVVVVVVHDDAQRLSIRFVNAGQLVEGNEVKVGGVAVGTVKTISLSEDKLAEVDVEITDVDLLPLHEGTRAEIRQSSLSSVANRFIQLKPGPNSAAPLPDGATIDESRSESIVEIDSVLGTLNAETRGAAQALLRNTRAVFEGRSAEANRGLIALSPALTQLDLLARELGRDRQALRGLLVQTASVVSTIASRDGDVRAGLSGAAATASELAEARRALASVLKAAPPTLGRAATTLDGLSATFDDVRPAARELRPVAQRSRQLLRTLEPLLARSPGAIADVRALLPDVTAALRDLPATDRAARPSVAALRDALEGSLPILRGALPYVPDVFHGIVTGFGNAAVSSYDANGHYARVSIAAGFALTGAPSELLNGERVLGARSGLNKRCPGGAYPNVRDSANNTTQGDPTCDPDDAP